MHTRNFSNNPFSGHLDVVAHLRDEAIQASIKELARQDELTIACDQLLKQGVDINDLSEASGLPTDQIIRRTQRGLALGEDLAGLAGIR
jgi:hypothetical protein